MMRLAKSLTTIVAFMGKELIEVVRRPGALVSLVIGPFVIMVLFGLGFVGFGPDRRAVLVVPPDAALPADVADYADSATGIQVVDVVADVATAEARLKAREIDLVVVAPVDLAARVAAGEQPVVEIMINEVDPVAHGSANYVADLFSAEINRRIIEEVARRAQKTAAEAGGLNASDVPPEVIASPTDTVMENIAPVDPSVSAFFGTAMIAFVLQHLSVSLMGLSLMRERAGGSFELFRVAPVGATEIVLGKFAAFTLIAGGVATLLTLLLVNGLGVPMAGDPRLLVLTFGLVTAASLGLGVVIAMLADSERQVVQLALLLLLASIFFTGFVLSPEQFAPFAQPLMNLFPATHGIALTRDLMLYGWVEAPEQFLVLGAMTLILFLTGSRLVRWRMQQT